MARILCVEDELDIRAGIVEELTESGHLVAQASNGKEGLEVAKEFCPDIILCDSLMPEMTGPEMISALREQDGAYASAPVILLSAYADKWHKDEARASGATVYMTKPVDFDELDAVIESLCS